MDLRDLPAARLASGIAYAAYPVPVIIPRHNILSYGALRRLYRLFRPWRWEDGGQIYQKVFRIRIWKDYIPAVGAFDKKQLAANPDTAYVSRYLLESLRAELCHLIALLSGIAIMAFSSWDSGRRILAWEIAVNVPCI